MLSFSERLISIINFNNIARVPLRLLAVLAGDNAATFDVPMLLRNGEHNFVAELTSVNIRCTDSVELFKFLLKDKHSSLKNEQGQSRRQEPPEQQEQYLQTFEEISKNSTSQ